MNTNDSGAAPPTEDQRLDQGTEIHERRRALFISTHGISVAFSALPYFLTAILTFVLFYSLYDMWGQDLRMPITPPVGDYLATAIFAKSAMQTGWCATNSHLGAPQGFECFDFPMPDGIHLGFFALFGRFSSDAVLAINVYYILGYVLIALTSLFVFRHLGFSTIPSIPASLLFAFLPHHYVRGEYHLFLSAYYLLPLMVMVIVWIYRGEQFVTRFPEKRFRYRLTKKGIAAAVICLLMGCGGIYYAAFALLFLLTTALLVFLRSARMADLLPAGLAGAMIFLAILVNLTPNLLFFRIHGTDSEVAHRSPAEADAYGMKIAKLLLPITEHRLPAFAKLKSRYLADFNHGSDESDRTVALGLVMGFGFLVLIADLFCTGDRELLDVMPLFSRLNLAAVLVATLGGFGSLFNFLVFPEIRVYARISVYIAFFALTALLQVLKRYGVRWQGAWKKTLILNAAAAGIMFAGIWDLTPVMSPAHAEIAGEYNRDRDFIRRIEAVVPRGAMIYQLPYMSFPEAGYVNRMVDYDPARGFLISDDLRWSYGAMRGRPGGEWQRRVAELPVRQLLDTLKQSGFAGIWIDRFGYKDGAASITAALQGALGVEPLHSAGSRFLFLSLADYPRPESGMQDKLKEERMRKAATALPMGVSFEGCSGLETGEGMNWRWCGQTGKIVMRNESDGVRTELVEMTLRSGYTQPAHFHIGGDLWSGDVSANSTGNIVSLKIHVAPGLHAIEIKTDAKRVDAPGDPRDMRFSIMDFRLTDQ